MSGVDPAVGPVIQVWRQAMCVFCYWKSRANHDTATTVSAPLHFSTNRYGPRNWLQYPAYSAPCLASAGAAVGCTVSIIPVTSDKAACCRNRTSAWRVWRSHV